MIREGLEGPFEEDLNAGGRKWVGIWWKVIAGRVNSKCKGLEIGASLVH